MTFLTAERDARTAQRGLWAEAAYQVRHADMPAELLRYQATFQVIQGQVVRVAQARGVIYLNFDRHSRQAFSVSLRRDDRGLLGIHAGDPKLLEGRTMRVRGWVEQRRGPSIDLSGAGQVEVLDEVQGQPGRYR